MQTTSWILGASSGIGEALARELAARGERVAISARNAEALDSIVATLPGSGHLAVPLDVSDCGALAETTQRVFDHFGTVNRVIFMAGLYSPMRFGAIDLKEAEQIIRVNLTSAFYVVETVLPRLLAQPGGAQIALCASVAGYRGLPKSQPYGATKAGLINLAESLRAEMPARIDVRVINPGFVESRLTEKNDFAMPMRISAERAGKAVADGLAGRAFEIHFPKGFTLIMKLLSWLPGWLYFRIVR